MGGPEKKFGGANFIAFPLPSQKRSGRTVLSVNLNYIFVNPPDRGQGYFTRLVQDFPDIVLNLFSLAHPAGTGAWTHDPPPVYVFAEQNDPYKLSAEEYARDTDHSGIDQVARIEIWAKRGFRIIDFDYVQPALTAAQAPDYTLAYSLLKPGGGTLDPCLLQAHLRRFFGISVLKGRDPLSETVASTQLHELGRLCDTSTSVSLLTIDPPKLKRPDLRAHPQQNLRDVLR